MYQAGDKLYLLLHAPAQLFDPLVAPSLQFDPLQPLLRQRPRLLGVNALEPGQEDEHFHYLLVPVQSPLLRQVADSLPALARLAAQQFDLAGVGSEDIHEDADRTGLAGPVGSEQPEDLTGIDIERQVFDSGDTAEPFVQMTG